MKWLTRAGGLATLSGALSDSGAHPATVERTQRQWSAPGDGLSDNAAVVRSISQNFAEGSRKDFT